MNVFCFFWTRVFSPLFCLDWTSIWSYCHSKNGRMFVKCPRLPDCVWTYALLSGVVTDFCDCSGCADYGMAGRRESRPGQICQRKSDWPVLSSSNTTRTSVIRTLSKEEGKNLENSHMPLTPSGTRMRSFIVSFNDTMLFADFTNWIPKVTTSQFSTCHRFLFTHGTFVLPLTTRCGKTTAADCFLGCDLVEWLQQVGLAQDPGEAVLYGKRLQQGSVLQHIKEEHDFLNSPLYYRFITWDPTPPTPDHTTTTVWFLSVWGTGEFLILKQEGGSEYLHQGNFQCLG